MTVINLSKAQVDPVVNQLFSAFQTQREDPLPLGFSNGREAELLESVLQPLLLRGEPRAGAFHSALQLQVSVMLLMVAQDLTSQVTTANVLDAPFAFFVPLQVLEEHVPSVWPVHAPASVRRQHHPDSKREKPKGPEHVAGTRGCEWSWADSLSASKVIYLKKKKKCH